NCSVHKFPMAGPDDVSGLEELFDRGAIEPADVVCIIAKTEGNGRVNDFSRPLAHRAFRDVLSARTQLPSVEVDARVAFIMSGGFEAILSPHATVVARKRDNAQKTSSEKRLTFAMASTRE